MNFTLLSTSHFKKGLHMTDNLKEEKVDLTHALLEKIHNDQVKSKRWENIFRLIKASTWILMIAFMFYVTTNKPNQKDTEPHIAMINITGEISAGELTDSSNIIPSITHAFENKNSVAVVLTLDSPGGSPVISHRIYEEIMYQKKQHPNKKVYGVIGDLCASGCYYIASSVDELIADPTSLVGSIGVITSGFGFSGIMEKVGITRRVITAGESKDLMDPYQPLKPEIESYWKTVLAETHKQFISDVKAGRGERLKSDEHPEIFTGLMWTGNVAKELGLIDSLGSFQTIQRDITKTEKVIDYSPKVNIFGKIQKYATTSVLSFIKENSSIKTSLQLQ